MMGRERVALVWLTGVAHLICGFRLACYQRISTCCPWHVLKQ
jgi:hypothetical protein